MRACICQALLHGDLERPREALQRGPLALWVVGAVPSPCTASDSCAHPGGRVMETELGWGFKPHFFSGFLLCEAH